MSRSEKRCSEGMGSVLSKSSVCCEGEENRGGVEDKSQGKSACCEGEENKGGVEEMSQGKSVIGLSVVSLSVSLAKSDMV